MAERDREQEQEQGDLEGPDLAVGLAQVPAVLAVELAQVAVAEQAQGVVAVAALVEVVLAGAEVLLGS